VISAERPQEMLCAISSLSRNSQRKGTRDDKIRISERLGHFCNGLLFTLTTVTGCQKAEAGKTQNTASVEKNPSNSPATRSPGRAASGAN